MVSSQLGKGGLQDTLPNSGRARVGSNYYFVIPGNDPESHSWTDYEVLLFPSPIRGWIEWGATKSFVIPGCDPESHS